MKFLTPLQLKTNKQSKKHKQKQQQTKPTNPKRKQKTLNTHTYLLHQKQRQLEITQKSPSAQSLFCFPGLNGQEVPSPLVVYTHALKQKVT